VEGKLVDKISLENGLVLEIHDRSKRVAGDRWLVSFLACLNVPVSRDYFQDQDAGDISFHAILNAVGKEVTYSYEKTRNFIGEDEKDEIFNGLKERFLKTTFIYLSSTKFPRNIILSKYRQVTGDLPWKSNRNPAPRTMGS
jgi:hypothetical protein